MINICKTNGKIIKSFKNDDAFNHLSAKELLAGHPEIDTIHWGFVIFSPKIVPNLYLKLKQKPVQAPLKEAYEQQLGVIEMCKGDYENPTYIPITPNLDIGTVARSKLKKGWYLECCKKHDFFVVQLNVED